MPDRSSAWRLSVSAGNKVIVATGLAMVGASFAWVSTASTATPSLEIAGQMVLAGIGLGFTTAPATEAIMRVVPPDKATTGPMSGSIDLDTARSVRLHVGDAAIVASRRFGATSIG